MVLGFDDVLVPTGLPDGIDCRGADDYKLAQVAKNISERIIWSPFARRGQRCTSQSAVDVVDW